eukprot:UN34169
MFFAVRFLCIYIAFSGSFAQTFIATLLQFIVVPYSLFMAWSYGAETAFVLYTGSIIIFTLFTALFYEISLPWIGGHYGLGLMDTIVGFLGDWAQILNWQITISPTFTVLFLLADQLICTYCMFTTPKGTTYKFSKFRIMQSVFMGFEL